MDITKPRGKVIATYKVDYLKERFNVASKTVSLHGYTFKASTKSLTDTKRKILLKSPTCACCGRKGDTFILEDTSTKNTEEISLRLYSTEEYSKKGRRKYIAFNVDHIIPRALGGSNGQYNLQTMCVQCNSQKGAHIQSRYLSARLIFKLLKYNKGSLIRVTKTLIKQKIREIKNNLNCSTRKIVYRLNIF